MGSPGKGRALGLGELKFSGQVLPTMKSVVYGLEIKRVMRSKQVLGIADGWLSDGRLDHLSRTRSLGRIVPRHRGFEASAGVIAGITAALRSAMGRSRFGPHNVRV